MRPKTIEERDRDRAAKAEFQKRMDSLRCIYCGKGVKDGLLHGNEYEHWCMKPGFWCRLARWLT